MDLHLDISFSQNILHHVEYSARFFSQSSSFSSPSPALVFNYWLGEIFAHILTEFRIRSSSSRLSWRLIPRWEGSQRKHQHGLLPTSVSAGYFASSLLDNTV